MGGKALESSRKQKARMTRSDYVFYDSCIEKVDVVERNKRRKPIGSLRKQKAEMAQNESPSLYSSADLSVSSANTNVDNVGNITEMLKQDATRVSLQRCNSLCFQKKGERIKDSPEECFKPLTKEEEREVVCAFEESNKRKVLVSHENSNLCITGEELQCLMPEGWLNDVVINAYLELLKEREKREPKKFLRCHFFNSFFYKRITEWGGYSYNVAQRWTRPEKLGYSLLGCDKIFVPIHQINHWSLAVINNMEKKFQYLDSLKPDPDDAKPQVTLDRKKKVLDTLAVYYADEVKDKNGKDIDVSSWERDVVADLPTQDNEYDCGVFMIKYVDFYSRDIGLCFSQEDMPYFRKRMAVEILNLKIDTGFVAPLEAHDEPSLSQKTELPGARRWPPRWGADFYF